MSFQSVIVVFFFFHLSDIFNPVKNLLLTNLAQNHVGSTSTLGLFYVELAELVRTVNSGALLQYTDRASG